MSIVDRIIKTKEMYLLYYTITNRIEIETKESLISYADGMAYCNNFGVNSEEDCLPIETVEQAVEYLTSHSNVQCYKIECDNITLLNT